MLNRLSLAASVLLLSSCAYVLDGSVQKLTVETPGAYDATCDVWVDGLRYKASPPQTINISKSHNNMTVDCFAPGNRHRKIIIEPTLSKNAGWNVTNGVVPGAAWDYASDALYEYPETVYVDFSSAETLPERLPSHNNPDIKQPEEYPLEEFRPGLPRLNSDKDRLSTEIIRRQTESTSTNGSYKEDFISEEAPSSSSDKGNLRPITSKSQAKSAPQFPGQ